MSMAKSLMLTAADVQPISEARPLGAIAVRRGPISDIAIDADGPTIVATNHGDNSVSVLDARSLTVRAIVPVAGEPFAVTMARGRAYVAASMPTYDALSAIDTREKTFLASLPLNQQIVDVAAGHDGARLFVAGTQSDTAELAIVDVETGRVDVVKVAAGADRTVNAVRVAPNGRLVYVATSDIHGGSLAVVDAARRRVVAMVPTVAPIRDVVLGDDGCIAYVLGCHPEYGGVVETIDTTSKRVLATTWIGGWPTQFALGADGTRMYLVDVDRVAVLCMITHEITDTIAAGRQPSCVAISPDGHLLYVADYSGVVSVFAVGSPSSFDVLDVDTIAVPEVWQLEPV